MDLFINSIDRSFVEEFVTVATALYHSDITTVYVLPLHGNTLLQVRGSRRMRSMHAFSSNAPVSESTWQALFLLESGMICS